jgi:DNA-binding HxlR family transcriptional regulator
MAGKRTYGDSCGVARALDLVGERWALLVVRELLLGPKRFTDLRAGLVHLGPDVLSQRLRELEQAGILRRRTLAPPAASKVYELTEWGRELEPVVLQLGRWGSRAPLPPREPELGVDASVLALKTLFSPAAAAGHSARYELRLGDQHFAARVADGTLELARGEASDPDAVITTDPRTLVEVLWHGRALADARSAGDMTTEGSLPAAKRFLALFAVPQPAPAVAPPQALPSPA